MKNSFSFYITKFFKEYLPLTRGLSNNTIKSYRDTILLLLEYYEKILKIKSKNIKLEDLTLENIENFLIWLEENKKIKISSRNVRLAGIITFFKYLQKQELSYFDTFANIISIKNKRAPESIVTYMSIDEVKKLLCIPNSKSKKELRDLIILVLLYETGCRVQELIDLTLENIVLNSQSYIVLTGKGNKTRKVPVSEDVANILGAYFKVYSINTKTEYLLKNKYNNKFTRQGIQYIIDKYIEKARNLHCNLFKDRISPHSFRHSKAMHLVEADVNLIYIRDFLGHVSVTTTEIYAKANPEIKRREIINHSETIDINKFTDDTDKQVLEEWLKNHLI